jgi:LPXTG-motif cell wall-anchored protein
MAPSLRSRAVSPYFGAPLRRRPSPQRCSVCRNLMSDTINDVPPSEYTTVIREMIRHENDLTNHRIMWLLVGEGFIANAFVSVVKTGEKSTHLLFGLGGLLIALSAFVMLYRSYQARGYLRYLGMKAKQGRLREKHLPLTGWPSHRIKGWRRGFWVSVWFGEIRDLFEPWLLLPYVFASLWMISLLHTQTDLNIASVLILGMILSTGILSASCIAMVRLQGEEDESTEE